MSKMDPEFRPELDDEAPVDAAARAVIAAGNALAQATAHEMALEAGRALEKSNAIRRLIEAGPNELTGKPHSASSAEAIASTDPEYATYLARQREAVIAKIQAQASYDSAVLIALGLTAPRAGLFGSAA